MNMGPYISPILLEYLQDYTQEICTTHVRAWGPLACMRVQRPYTRLSKNKVPQNREELSFFLANN